MITNLEDGGKTNCQQYWPDSGSKSFGPYCVSVTDQPILADYTIRSLSLEVWVWGVCMCVCVCMYVCVNVLHAHVRACVHVSILMGMHAKSIAAADYLTF